MAKKRKARPEFDRTVFDVLRAIRGKTDKEVADKCFVSVQTVRRMRLGPRYGGTRYPQHLTLEAIARSVGLAFKLVDETEREAELARLKSEVALLQREMKEAAKLSAIRKARREERKRATQAAKAVQRLKEAYASL